jgi:uncharacterized protein
VIEYGLTSECHVLDIEHDAENFIAYFPLKSLVLKVNSTAADVLIGLKEKPAIGAHGDALEFLGYLQSLKLVNGPADILPDPPRHEVPEPVSTLLLLSDRCNLRCLYCYGSSDSSGNDMPFEIGKAAVDTILGNAIKRESEFIEVGFHGGGEPTINWDVLLGIIEYAEKQCLENNVRLKSSICSNGMMDDDQAKWLADHISSITISIDGPPEVQDRQRPTANGAPSYTRVARTIDVLGSRLKPYALRVTATGLPGPTLPDVYTFLTGRFNPMTVCIEPLFVCGRCTTSLCQPPAEGAFTRDLIEIADRSLKSGVSVQYSGGRLFFLDTRFCGAAGSNFFVTPRGDVTACVEVSRRQDPRAEVFMYGNFEAGSGGFTFDIAKYQRLVRLRVQDFDSCKECFARWHCCGDCLAKAPALTKIGEQRNAYRCGINRSFTKHQLLQEMEGNNAGRSLNKKKV